MQTLNKHETLLIGHWLIKDGTMVQDQICDRIEWLVSSYFDEIAIDGENWSALYRNPDDGAYWELTYPQSHMHGGGPPKLELIPKSLAETKYKGV